MRVAMGKLFDYQAMKNNQESSMHKSNLSVKILYILIL